MTALSVTAAQVLPSTPCTTRDGIGGAAITQGQTVYFDTATGTWKLAQADGTAAEAGQDGYGIALTACGASGQPVVVALPGSVITIGAGAAPAAGTVYGPGDAAGSLAPMSDMGTTDKVLPLAIGLTTNRLKILTDAYHAGAVVP